MIKLESYRDDPNLVEEDPVLTPEPVDEPPNEEPDPYPVTDPPIEPDDPVPMPPEPIPEYPPPVVF